MLVAVPAVLSKAQVAEARARIDAEGWVDGRETAGTQSAIAKHNLQLPKGSPAAAEIGAIILDALANNGLFMSAALPRAIFPPLS